MVDANFANDPEAAHIVLRSGANITLVGMDVTMTTLFSTEMVDEVAREGDEAAKTLMRMVEFYVNAYENMYPGIAGCGLHDPLAVAVAEDPSLARTERMFVDVELHGELTRGQTIADRRLTAIPLHNADVCVDINRPRFLTNFLAAIKGQ
jgi:purine nucleosidase